MGERHLQATIIYENGDYEIRVYNMGKEESRVRTLVNGTVKTYFFEDGQKVPSKTKVKTDTNNIEFMKKRWLKCCKLLILSSRKTPFQQWQQQ